MWISVTGAGCLLPLLVFLNLIFGWLIFKPVTLWLAIEGILIVLFLLNSYIFIKRFSSFSSSKKNKNAIDNAIDVEGEVIEEKQRLK
jgi:hypothetical protein